MNEINTPLFTQRIPGSQNAAEYRTEVQKAQEQRALARQAELESQTSMRYAPQERILIWERLHAVRLPASAAHPLVEVIAAQTQLSVGEIQAEQQRRAGVQQPSRSDQSL